MAIARVHRLTKSDDFTDIKRRGKKISSGGLVSYICPNTKNVSRLAVVCSSKLGDAHKRNRLKRLAGEVFRLNLGRFKMTADVVVIAQKEIMPALDFRNIEKIFLQILERSGIIEK